MTSTRKIKANRANAKASTGPRTKQGKSRAGKNALRHGLSSSMFADPTRVAEVENMTNEIAGQNATPEVIGPARHVAEARIDLQRIREARLHLLARDLSDPYYRPKTFFSASNEMRKTIVAILRKDGPMARLPAETAKAAMALFRTPEGAEKFASVLSDYTKQLMVIDRYQRRALSRLKFAIRAFDAARRQAAA